MINPVVDLRCRHYLLSFVTLAQVYATAAVANHVSQQQALINPTLPGDHHHTSIVSETTSLLALHRVLVEIDSTPDNENDVGVYLETYLRSLNFTVERQNLPHLPDHVDEHHGQRFNIFAYPPGNRETPILMTSHMDTVPIHYPYKFDPTTQKISGRGSVDAKACIATQIHAALRIRSDSPSLANNISLLFVVGEEVAGDGMRIANDLNIPWKHVIFGEPTEGKLASGHKGLQIFRVIAHGKATHSGYPWLGHSANVGLIRALNALLAIPWPSSSKYGNSTINIGYMDGGVAANIMPERAIANIGIRIAGGTVEKINALIYAAVESVMNNKSPPSTNHPLGQEKAENEAEEEDIDLDFPMDPYPPVDIDCDADLSAQFGKGECITVNYGTDIPNLKGQHKRYLYGPGSILVAHSDHEHLYVDDLVRAVDDYERLVRIVAGRL